MEDPNSPYFKMPEDCDLCDACHQVKAIDEMRWARVRLWKNEYKPKICLVCLGCAMEWV